ncbi:MAG: dephospho-CoA kinase [Muribaculaceae bacterium]|nr:dephospho-CoA kinase [Muribaculaceae bacterium]
MKHAKLTAITGGIGAGKSVVSKILRTMGYPVFDCDSEAKHLMDSSPEIKAALIEKISPEAVDGRGNINRSHIAQIVFSDSKKLEQLNTIVHTAVRNEIERWRKNNSDNKVQLFVETAILYQSQLDKAVDDVWEVVAPDEVRILRVMDRNHCSRQDVISRIEAQSFVPDVPHNSIKTITNDDFTPVLPQILNLLEREQ